MNYETTLSFDNQNGLYKCLVPELSSLSSDRFSCSMNLVNNKIKFSISAKDEIAFNAIKSSVKKLVLIHTKVQNIVKN